jgi:FAD/FMN-containing dehydrogenase
MGDKWSVLSASLDGDIVVPGEPEYEWTRKPFIARFDDIQPQAVALCQHADDVAEVIAFARDHDIQVAVRSGGHCFAGYSSTDGLVIDVSPMANVRVLDDTAQVGAGTRIGPLSRTLVEHGVVVPGGSCPTVGIGGTTLGGGLGILGRYYGLTCDHMIAAEVVLANGRTVVTDAEHEPNLNWALRGAGGGNFGVVTSFTFQTRPAPSMTNFYYVWDFRHAAKAIEAWQRWAPTAPDELAAGLAVTATDDPEEPPFVEVYGAMLGSASDLLRQLDWVVDQVNAPPATARHRELGYRETADFQAGVLSAANVIVQTPQGPIERQGHRFTKSEFFDRPLPAEAIDRLVAVFAQERSAGEYRGLEWAPWGGQYNRVPADSSAFVHRSQLYSLKHAVLVDPARPAEQKSTAHRWVRSSWEAVHPWGNGGVYPNFPDPELPDWGRAYYGSNFSRLIDIKRQYDPDNFFTFPQSIPVHFESQP